MGQDSPPTTQQPLSFRPRRAHEKSRNGCMRCKKQRKKCDEAKPRCSRCDVRGYTCQYATEDSNTLVSAKKSKASPGSVDGLDFSHLTIPPDSWSEMSSQFSASNVSISPSPIHHHHRRETNTSAGAEAPYAHSVQALDGTELALLSHYLAHTSRTIPVDAVDRYALQVGIPNLALHSGTVMSSLLALAAVEKCHGLARADAALGGQAALAGVRELLEFAGDHHKASLRQIQATIQTSTHYEAVLANAPLMVLYCSADHAVRVRLAREARLRGVSLPGDLLPAQSQWISLIRAAHAAYSGLSNSPSDDGDDDDEHEFETNIQTPLLSPASEIQERRPLMACLATPEDAFIPEDGPSKGTRQLLFPIVANTYRSALAKLQRRAMAISASGPSGAQHMAGMDELYVYQQQQQQHPYSSCKADLDATLTALQILQDVADTVCSNLDAQTPTGDGVDSPEQVPPPVGRLRHVSPWLRAYSARVTSATPTRRPRRTIMAFLNRIPIEYLHFVQSILDLMPSEPPDAGPPREHGGQGQWAPSDAHRLAMDVFAHWLVLVMLLDGVWWIGETGEWELGRVVSFMRARGWTDAAVDGGDKWWPQSMLRVKTELAGHMSTSEAYW